MTTPAAEPLLTVPYVSVAEFRADPTWIDSNDLIEGGIQSQQDAELYNQLLKASAWANNFVMMPLKAHKTSDFTRARVTRDGRIFLHPKNTPVRQVTGLSYGSDPTLMNTVTSLSTMWIEDQRGIIIALDTINGMWAGTLQFGSAPSQGREVFVYYEYIAGYGNAVLTSATAVNATNLTVDDPTGFQPPSTSLLGSSMGGSIARIWDPLNPTNSTGGEEAVAIASNYVPGNSPLVLASGTANAHAAGCQVSEFPAEVRQAIIQYTVGLLMRDDASDDLPFPGSPGITARRADSRGAAGGMITEAERLLMPYRRVR